VISNKLFEHITDIYNNYDFLSQSIPKIGSVGDSKRLRDGITHALTLANQKLIESQPLVEQLEKFKKSKNKEIKDTAYKLLQKYNFFEEGLKKMNVLSRSLMEEKDIPKGGNPFDETTPLVSQEEHDYNEQLLKKQQQFLQLENERDFQDSIIHQRDEEIKVIQQQMRDVNVIYKDIANLVQYQGEMFDNIMLNISEAGKNVNVAVEKVDQAKKYSNKSRRKLCFLAICITIVVAGAVIVVIALFGRDKEQLI